MTDDKKGLKNTEMAFTEARLKIAADDDIKIKEIYTKIDATTGASVDKDVLDLFEKHKSIFSMVIQINAIGITSKVGLKAVIDAYWEDGKGIKEINKNLTNKVELKGTHINQINKSVFNDKEMTNINAVIDILYNIYRINGTLESGALPVYKQYDELAVADLNDGEKINAQL